MFTLLKIAEQSTSTMMHFVTDAAGGLARTAQATATFEVPGGFEGVLRIDALWGTDDNRNNKCDSGESTCIDEDSKITLGGAELNVSKTAALPNDTVIINGNGFATSQDTVLTPPTSS